MKSFAFTRISIDRFMLAQTKPLTTFELRAFMSLLRVQGAVRVERGVSLYIEHVRGELASMEVKLIDAERLIDVFKGAGYNIVTSGTLNRVVGVDSPVFYCEINMLAADEGLAKIYVVHKATKLADVPAGRGVLVVDGRDTSLRGYHMDRVIVDELAAKPADRGAKLRGVAAVVYDAHKLATGVARAEQWGVSGSLTGTKQGGKR